MQDSGYYLTVYIVARGCPTVNEYGEPGEPSKTGHMRISIDSPVGLKQPYGFHPAVDGKPISEGKVKTMDLHTYREIYYQKRFPITEDMYRKLQNYCENARIHHTFGPYIGFGNACVDFAWDVMCAAGIYPLFLDHEAWPTNNVLLVDAAYGRYMFTLKIRRKTKERLIWDLA